jgi:hypothetical protein
VLSGARVLKYHGVKRFCTGKEDKGIRKIPEEVNKY